jgi:hypothetical protein
MGRKSSPPQGWVALKEAADRLRLHFETLRTLVKAEQFTRLRKTPGENAAIYIPEDEVTAFVTGGGLDAVARLRRAKLARQIAEVGA